ncbi:hypothetical protein BaRGS_00009147 [Batillaria attramentaria]|uniref:Uncharacterized protein n=1 Tax=Batillaria attramentaria TaxID=370345 RepID=A0ABD0LJ63_9CAEN
MKVRRTLEAALPFSVILVVDEKFQLFFKCLDKVWLTRKLRSKRLTRADSIVMPVAGVGVKTSLLHPHGHLTRSKPCSCQAEG